MRSSWIRLTSAVVVLLATTMVAWATPLSPGVSVTKPGTAPVLPTPHYTAGGLPGAYSTLVLSTAFPYSGGFTGSVTSAVYANGSGDLAFTYKFTNTSPAANELIRATLDDPSHPWLGVTILDAGADGLGLSTAGGSPAWTNGDPSFILRDSINANPDIQWRTGGNGTSLASATNTSSLIWFTTNARSFRATNVGLTDSGIVGTSTAWGPAPVPEPSTLALLIAGVLGLAAYLWRRRS